MIEYNNDLEGADVYCDSCSYSEYFDGDFMEVVAEIRDDGWRITTENFDYKHTCPVCVEKETDLEDHI